MSERLLVRQPHPGVRRRARRRARRPAGRELPSWEPGAHLDVHLRDGLSRQFSLPATRTTASATAWACCARRRAAAARRTCTTCCAPVTWSSTSARATTSGSSRPRRTCSSPAASASRRSCRCWPGPRPRGLRGRSCTADARPRRWRSRASCEVRRTGHPAPAGQPRPARPRRPARHAARGHARLLLRSRAAATRRGGADERAGRTPCTSNGSPPPRSRPGTSPTSTPSRWCWPSPGSR